MDWTTILATNNISEPPGRQQTVAQAIARTKAKADAKAQLIKDKRK